MDKRVADMGHEEFLIYLSMPSLHADQVAEKIRANYSQATSEKRLALAQAVEDRRERREALGLSPSIEVAILNAVRDIAP